MWLEEAKRDKLLTMLKGWIQAATRGQSGIAFAEFRTVMAKIQHAFMCIHLVGIVDASKHGVGGVVFGEGSKCIPTVFRWQWPEEISKDVKTETNPSGRITNSDLEIGDGRWY